MTPLRWCPRLLCAIASVEHVRVVDLGRSVSRLWEVDVDRTGPKITSPKDFHSKRSVVLAMLVVLSIENLRAAIGRPTINR